MRRIAPLAAVLAAVAVLTACGSGDHPKPISKAEACKLAMAKELTEQQLLYTAGGVVPDGVFPDACDGIGDEALKDTAAQILADRIKDG